MTSPLVRFAPSPTGYLHIGNARPALFNWLFARRHRGRFLLRYDDTDIARSKAEYADAIAEDLGWLGIVPDQVIKQSERLAIYDAAADKLRGAGRLYACYETADELDRRRRRQLARGLPPIYDRAALKLTDEQKAAFAAEGRKPHWRFLLEAREVAWDDLVRGTSHVDCASLSDPVLVREDGSYLYTLPSVVDDIETGVSHVIRGEDHVTNTAVQAQIFEALGASLPAFGHHNLLTTASGEGLSKRLGHLSLRGLRATGVEALAVAALATLVGTSDAVRPVASLDELAGLVELAHVSRATGQPYSSLANAGKYTRSFDAACTCRGQGQSWSAALRDAEYLLDKRKGDVILSEQRAAELSRPKADPKRKGAAAAQPAAVAPVPVVPDEKPMPSEDSPTSGTESAGVGPDIVGEKVLDKKDGLKSESRSTTGERRTVRIVAPNLAPNLSPQVARP